MVAENLYYSHTHEWLRVEDDIGTIGITDFAAKQLGDLVYIDLPAVGAVLRKGERFGEIESVKAVSELFSPASGEVIASNESITAALDTISKDAYNAGWLVKVKMSNPSEIEELLSSEQYQKLCEAD